MPLPIVSVQYHHGRPQLEHFMGWSKKSHQGNEAKRVYGTRRYRNWCKVSTDETRTSIKPNIDRLRIRVTWVHIISSYMWCANAGSKRIPIPNDSSWWCITAITIERVDYNRKRRSTLNGSMTVPCQSAPTMKSGIEWTGTSNLESSRTRYRNVCN